MVKLPVLPAHPECTACKLHTTPPHHVGIAGRPAGLLVPTLGPFAQQPDWIRHPTALLVIGEAPGRKEDIEAQPFIGVAGGYLHTVYLDGPLKMLNHSDVYLTNACRCRPPDNATPTSGQIKACKPWLIEDIRILQQHYKEVVLLCTGGPAVEAVWGDCSLSESFGKQGEQQVWGWAGTEDLRPCRVFSTYHPINLHRGRNPSRIAAIKDHLRLLFNYLSGSPIKEDADAAPILCPPSPNYPIKRLSLDIETYGFVRAYPKQTSFHPRKCKHFDRPKQLIVTVAIAWRDEEGELQHGCFLWGNPAHRTRLLEFIRRLNGDLVGQNIKFDLMMLRSEDLRFRLALNDKVHITELSVLNYLHNEQRPERSLKNVALLLGQGRYSSVDMDKERRYASDDDPTLLTYNTKDAILTLLCVEELERRIRTDYPDSPKLSDYCRRWYSRLIWTCIHMEESGVAFDGHALEDLDFSTVCDMALLYSECRHRYDLLLSGKGSDASKKDLFVAAVEESGLVGDDRVELTEKRHEIAINRKNAALLIENLEPTSVLSIKLRKQQQYETLAKLVTSYTRPMLHGTEKNPHNARLIPPDRTDSLTNRKARLGYPSWFPVPSQFDSGKEGGTIQGRITAKDPPVQTLPKHSPIGKRLQKCFTTRFNPGFLISVDLSQIELRVAALLSGDPVMMDEYRRGVDRHTQTGLEILGYIVEDMKTSHLTHIIMNEVEYPIEELQLFLTDPKPRQYPRFDLIRQIGKTANFLMAYWGKAFKLRGTIADDLGVVLPLQVVQRVVDSADIRYAGLRRYQSDLVITAKRTGRIELPLIGQSRIFVGSSKTIDDTYLNEIVNFPFQTTAANIMLDIQYALIQALSSLKRRVYVGLNIYDSVFIDGPMSQYGQVKRIIDKVFTAPDYYKRLCDHLDREVPLDYDVSRLVVHGASSKGTT